MKQFHLLSFITGILSGFVILVVVVGGYRMIQGPSNRGFGQNGARQFQGGNGGFNPARMAERMGISEEELQKELDSGKTMQQVAEEHGVTFGGPGGRGFNDGPRSGSGAARSGSGVASVSSSSVSSVQ